MTNQEVDISQIARYTYSMAPTAQNEALHLVTS